MSTPNAELAYAVLDHIEAHPERHDQGSFLRPSLDLRLMYDRVGRIDVTAEIAVEHCGTTACFAGWTALLSGKTLNHEGDVRTDGAGLADIADTAKSLLGIGAADSWHLFFEAQSLDQVRCFVAEIFGPRPGVPVPGVPRSGCDCSHDGGQGLSPWPDRGRGHAEDCPAYRPAVIR